MHGEAGSCDVRWRVGQNTVADTLAQRTEELSPLNVDDLMILIISSKAGVMSPERD